MITSNLKLIDFCLFLLSILLSFYSTQRIESWQWQINRNFWDLFDNCSEGSTDQIARSQRHLKRRQLKFCFENLYMGQVKSLSQFSAHEFTCVPSFENFFSSFSFSYFLHSTFTVHFVNHNLLNCLKINKPALSFRVK